MFVVRCAPRLSDRDADPRWCEAVYDLARDCGAVASIREVQSKSDLRLPSCSKGPAVRAVYGLACYQG